MPNKPQKTREEVISDWIANEAARQRKERRGRRLPGQEVTLTINSLMDAMTIILVFLLINYSVDPLKINSSEDLKLPASVTDLNPEVSTALTITRTEIVVNDKAVVEVKKGQDGVPAVDKVHKQGDENNPQIQPLFEALTKEAADQKQIAQLRGAKFGGMLTIIADKRTPYRLLTEVLYTANQAEFSKFKFAVLKGGQRG